MKDEQELGGPGAGQQEPRAVMLREEPPAPMALVPRGSDDNSPEALMRLALEKAGSTAEAVAALKELVGLKNAQEDRAAAKEYAQAMAEFKAALAKDPIVKDRKRDQASDSGASFTTTWASTKAIARCIDPKLAAVGLSYKWSYDLVGPNLLTTCRCKHVNGHFDETTVTMPTESKGGMSPQDKINSAQSRGERLSLTGVLGLTSSESTDVLGERADPTPIAKEEGDAILKRLGANEVSLKKFLDAMRVETIVEIPAVRLAEANLMIDQAIAAKKAKAAKPEAAS